LDDNQEMDLKNRSKIEGPRSKSSKEKNTALYGLNPEEIQVLLKPFNLPSYRIEQLLGWLYKKNITSWDDASNLPKEMTEKFSLTSLKPEEGGKGKESKKFLFRTHDNHLLESVLISQSGRQTVCLSTQLGCKVGCPFCASGKGPFNRDLSAGEIVEQVVWIRKLAERNITNVVFMGMGEPLDNFDQTMKALEILTEKWGFGMGGRRITVSTSGITHRILEFVERMGGRVRLSVSLHSSKPEIRDELVPINRRYTLSDLIKTLDRVHRELKRDITFEYTLLQDINDSEEEARGVAKIAQSLQAKVNLIPYNPIKEMDYKRPSPERTEQFQKILEDAGVKTLIRQTVGREIDAACGQLRLDREAI
jgi:23S rRNA (adenine2503-C2)-methyltransferase